MSEDLAALLNNAEPIKDGDERYATLLSDLQCNILSGHGRKEALYFFLRFTDPIKAKYLCGMLPRNPVERAMVWTTADSATLDKLPKSTRDSLISDDGRAGPWLLSKEEYLRLDGLMLTSEGSVRARSQSRQVERRSSGGAAAATEGTNDFAVNLLLTHRGYAKLTDQALPGDIAFRQGMARRNDLLNDPDPGSNDWDKDLVDVDGLLVVAYDPCATRENREYQNTTLKMLESVLEKHAGLVGRPQVGRVLTVKLGDVSKTATAGDKDKEVGIEPFGFRDGISQPVFYEADVDELERRGAVRARQPEAPDAGDAEANQARKRARRAAYAPLALALCPDPNGKTPHACGSYFVFRKLGQDIEKFYAQVDRLVQQTERDEEDVLADLVGRRRDGTPLGTSEGAGSETFDYRDDEDGARCPFHAHIRKANPRGDLPHDAREQRIVRRGVPYGPAIERDPTGKPKRGQDKTIQRVDKSPIKRNDIGLLFLCAQGSIEKQFERIQRDWANNPNFPWGKLPGADTIIGQRGLNEENRIRIQRKNKDLSEREVAYERVVSVCGGDYFFAPSISFLKALHDGLWK